MLGALNLVHGLMIRQDPFLRGDMRNGHESRHQQNRYSRAGPSAQ